MARYVRGFTSQAYTYLWVLGFALKRFTDCWCHCCTQRIVCNVEVQIELYYLIIASNPMNFLKNNKGKPTKVVRGLWETLKKCNQTCLWSVCFVFFSLRLLVLIVLDCEVNKQWLKEQLIHLFYFSNTKQICILWYSKLWFKCYPPCLFCHPPWEWENINLIPIWDCTTLPENVRHLTLTLIATVSHFSTTI